MEYQAFPDLKKIRESLFTFKLHRAELLSFLRDFYTENSVFSVPSNSPGGGLINLDSYDILRLVSNPESSLGNLRKSNEIKEEEDVDCTDDGPDHWRDLDRVITETARDFVCDGDEPLFLDFSAEEQSEMDSKPLSVMTFGGGVKRKSSGILLTPLITKGVLVHRLRNALFLA